MVDALAIINRVRSFGANLVVDDAGLRVVNGGRLPPEAKAFIAKHKQQIVTLLTSDLHAEEEERAGIIQHDGCLTKASAEYLTRLLMTSPPKGVDRADWCWFVEKAAGLFDDLPQARAA